MPNLLTGGAQRVVVLLSDYWSKNNNVTIAVLNKTEYIFKINSKVNIEFRNYEIKGIPKIKGILNLFNSIFFLRKLIKKNNPDVIISFLDTTNVISTLANLGKTNYLIISERLNPRFSNLPVYWIVLRKIFYQFSDSIIFQTSDIKGVMKDLKIKIPPNHRVIPNPVDIPLCNVNIYRKKKQILAVGRLHRQKGFDMLIKAYFISNVDWPLIICGEGEERNNLETLIADLNLLNKVQLVGNIKNIEKYYLESEIFVLSSRFEGMPNVLLEAMSYSCSCITFDCPSGPKDIIKNNYNGIILPPNDIDKMAQAIKFLTESDSFRSRISEQAIKVISDFSLDSIITKWEEAIP